MNEIKSTEFLAVMTDMWSSYASEPYMSYTAHFITEDRTLKSWCLQTLYVPEDHTGEIIAEAIQETLMWDIDVAKQVLYVIGLFYIKRHILFGPFI